MPGGCFISVRGGGSATGALFLRHGWALTKGPPSEFVGIALLCCLAKGSIFSCEVRKPVVLNSPKSYTPNPILWIECLETALVRNGFLWWELDGALRHVAIPQAPAGKGPDRTCAAQKIGSVSGLRF